MIFVKPPHVDALIPLQVDFSIWSFHCNMEFMYVSSWAGVNVKILLLQIHKWFVDLFLEQT